MYSQHFRIERIIEGKFCSNIHIASEHLAVKMKIIQIRANNDFNKETSLRKLVIIHSHFKHEISRFSINFFASGGV